MAEKIKNIFDKRARSLSRSRKSQSPTPKEKDIKELESEISVIDNLTSELEMDELDKEKLNPDLIAKAYNGEASEASADESSFDEDDFYIQYARGTVQGMIFLGLLKDQMILQKKVGIEESNLRIRDLCKKLYESDMLQKNLVPQINMDDIFKRASEHVENKLLDRELNSYKIDFPIPTNFSDDQTLFTISQKSDAMKMFPMRNKFSGTNKENVIEFLGLMTSAQEICNLSRSEFLEFLKMGTTGKAHQLVLSFIANGDSVEAIYHNLALHFDSRLSVPDSKKALNAYRAYKNQNFAEVASYIMGLASRISSEMPTESSRSALNSMEIYQGLLHALPAASKIYVNDIYNLLTSKLGRQVSGGELIRALNPYRSSIDEDIKAHGVESRDLNKSSKRQGQNGGYTPNNKGNPQQSQNFNQYRSGGSPGIYNKKPQQRTYAVGAEKAGNARSAPQQKTWNPNNKPGQINKYCSLCGRTNHTASDGCRNMINSKGQVVKLHPNMNVCTKCPQNVQPRLHHPEFICPFRPGGPFNRSQGTEPQNHKK